MLHEVVINAPAKLNIHLKVLPKRADGFHNIESVFQAIDLCDRLVVKHTGSQFDCEVEVVNSKLPKENTLTSAYAGFCTLTGIREGIHIKISKHIPCGSGLGGGSSDGAALIQALDELFETQLAHMQKVELALKVGSDVPFFLSGGTAVVTGRGEFVREIGLRNDLFFVVIQPDVHSSTKDAFNLFDGRHTEDNTQAFPDLAQTENMYQMPVETWTFGNSFTELLAERYPPIEKALKSLRQCGAIFSQMSGTGSAVYGVFCSQEDAKNAHAQLCRLWKCCIARPYSINRDRR